MQDTQGYVHHVIGAVHEITITSNSKAAVRSALEHEESECHAGRIVIDLTRIEPDAELLTWIETTADHEKATVRLAGSDNPLPLDSLPAAS